MSMFISVAMIKRPDKKQRRGERAYFNSQVQVTYMPP